MNEDLRKFMDLVKTDEALQKKLEEAVKNYDGEQNAEAAFNSIVAPIAKEAGLSLTLDSVKQSVQELSPDEMNQVAGGSYSCMYIGLGVGSNPHTHGVCFYFGVDGCLIYGDPEISGGPSE